jgi:arsenate reductase (thioredoxin)
MRSQFAEGMFRKMAPEHEVKSAGTKVEEHWEGKKMKIFDKKIIPCMDVIGIDIREQESKQLTLEMIEEADKVIVMAEKETWPDYLKDSDKVEHWDVEDPRYGEIEEFRKTRDDIQNRIKKLIEEL